jgi:hypothetical protein
MDQHVNRWAETNKAFRTVLAITVAAPNCQGVQCFTPGWEVRPPFSLPPRTTTLLLGHYRFQCQSVPPSKQVRS